MILVNRVANHRVHQKILLRELEGLKETEDTRLPHNLTGNDASTQSIDTVHSDFHLPKDMPRLYLDYFYSDVIADTMTAIGTSLGLNIQVDFDWDIHNTWFQQYYEHGEHYWHSHPLCNFTNVYFLELPDTVYRTEILDRHGEPIDYNAVEGDVLTFPGWMRHRSSPLGKGRKTVISFNSSFSLKRKMSEE